MGLKGARDFSGDEVVVLDDENAPAFQTIVSGGHLVSSERHRRRGNGNNMFETQTCNKCSKPT